MRRDFSAAILFSLDEKMENIYDKQKNYGHFLKKLSAFV